jgi:CheY-like chemotaxis protein
MALPRVLLVEDDPSLRRFVAMALEDMDTIELVQCDAVAPALALLAQGQFRLILTDLMMPGESGFDLIARLQRVPELRGPARVAVLSAGLTPAVREQLAGMDVWRLLSKPVSVSTLIACVTDALQGAEGAELPAAHPAAQWRQGGDRAHAIREYFEGNQELFDAYRSACMGQFPQDLRAGDSASAAGDLPALRRVAHSLKSVLLTLGYPMVSSLARTLEDTSHAGLLQPAREQWAHLRGAMEEILQPGDA